jgi:hypothetical protein
MEVSSTTYIHLVEGYARADVFHPWGPVDLLCLVMVKWTLQDILGQELCVHTYARRTHLRVRPSYRIGRRSAFPIEKFCDGKSWL